MKTLPLSEVKMKLSSLVDAINGHDEEIMITKNGKPAAYMISPDEYDGWRETLAIYSDPELLMQIRRSLAQHKKKKTKAYTLDELFSD